MKSSNKDKAAGKFHEAKGAIKEKTGKLIGDAQLEADGQDEKVGGKVQQVIGKIEKVVGD